jgi:regulator of sirC expression with transglutaminase-like and TPR domain
MTFFRNLRAGRERTESRREVLTYIYGDENFFLSQDSEDSRSVTPNDILRKRLGNNIILLLIIIKCILQLNSAYSLPPTSWGGMTQLLD